MFVLANNQVGRGEIVLVSNGYLLCGFSPSLRYRLGGRLQVKARVAPGDINLLCGNGASPRLPAPWFAVQPVVEPVSAPPLWFEKRP